MIYDDAALKPRLTGDIRVRFKGDTIHADVPINGTIVKVHNPGRGVFAAIGLIHTGDHVIPMDSAPGRFILESIVQMDSHFLLTTAPMSSDLYVRVADE